MKKLIIYIIPIFFSLSCKQQNTKAAIPKTKKKNITVEQQKIVNLAFLDTTIALPELAHLPSTRKKLTQEKAQSLLYKYFKGKGVIPKSEFKPSVYNYDQLCVSYDTIYNFQPNKLAGCVISYWLGPADLNGHCFQPSKSLILYTKTGYKLGYENFIPTNFAIDSVKGSSIYGFEYNCGSGLVIRNIQITLRYKE